MSYTSKMGARMDIGKSVCTDVVVNSLNGSFLKMRKLRSYNFISRASKQEICGF